MVAGGPLFFAAAGLFAAWIATLVLTHGETNVGGAKIVVLLVAPLLVYAIISGVLSQFKAGVVEVRKPIEEIHAAVMPGSPAPSVTATGR